MIKNLATFLNNAQNNINFTTMNTTLF